MPLLSCGKTCRWTGTLHQSQRWDGLIGVTAKWILIHQSEQMAASHSILLTFIQKEAKSKEDPRSKGSDCKPPQLQRNDKWTGSTFMLLTPLRLNWTEDTAGISCLGAWCHTEPSAHYTVSMTWTRVRRSAPRHEPSCRQGENFLKETQRSTNTQTKRDVSQAENHFLTHIHKWPQN